MATWDEFIIKYHLGGSLMRQGEVEYFNGAMSKFYVDPDKLCQWNLLGDVKELEYDIKNDVTLSYVDEEGTLTNIFDDQDIVGLINQLMTARIVDVYVET